MNERNIDCEKKCIIFAALSPEQKILNSNARLATSRGEEYPGSLNTLCGGCVNMEKTYSSLDEKKKEFLLV